MPSFRCATAQLCKSSMKRSIRTLHHAYCLYDGGEIAAYLLYDMHENEAVLQKLGGTWDENIADGLCRAAFSSLA